MLTPMNVIAAASGQAREYQLGAELNPSEVGWSTNPNTGLFGTLAPDNTFHDSVALQAIYTLTGDFKIQMSGIVTNDDETWSRIHVSGPGGLNIDDLDLLRADADTFGSIAGGRFEWTFSSIPATNFIDGSDYLVRLFWT